MDKKYILIKILFLIGLLFLSPFITQAAVLTFGGKNGEEFILDGKAIQIRAGELDPQRIPREYWRHRIKMCKAMGHINFGAGMRDDRKGIIGEVKLGDDKLSSWTMSLKPIDEESVINAKMGKRDAFSGGHYRARVMIEHPSDTFIDMSKWVKGTVYVNGVNIGRYWNIGPQLSLYCPASFLKKGENTIDIIELELTDAQPIKGLENPIYSGSEKSTKNAGNVW